MKKKYLMIVFAAILIAESHICLGQNVQWVLDPPIQWGDAEAGDPTVIQPVDVAVDDTSVYVAEGAVINVFLKDGTYVRSIGKYGIGDQRFARLSGIAVDNNNVYVTDLGGNDTDGKGLKVFEKGGAFLWAWSGATPSGTSGGGIIRAPFDVDVDDQYIYVLDVSGVHVFTKSGVFVNFLGINNGGHISIDGDKFIVGGNSYNDNVSVYDKSGVLLDDLSFSGDVLGLAADNRYVYIVHREGYTEQYFLSVFDKSWTKISDVVVTGGFRDLVADDDCVYMTQFRAPASIRVLKGPYYRTLGAQTFNELPNPEVLAVSQREGTTTLDIDYQVEDTDSTNVTVYAGAFAALRTDALTLDDFVPMRTFVDGTEANLGPGMLTGCTHRISWDMSTDGMAEKLGDYGNMHVKVMAKDDRGLIDFHFLTIPAMGANTSFEINRVPLTQEDLLTRWFWLLAAGDTDLSISTGCVYAVNGDFSGELLASGTDTTDEGRAFLFQKMGVREATSNEVFIAREGTTPGTVTEWEPRRTPPALGSMVNEFNFVTSPTNGWWVVPLP